MVAVIPFPGLRYNTTKTKDPLEAVVAPPYDVISPEQQEALYQKSPHNVVRLILGRQSGQDTPQDNRYTRAAKDLQEWLKQGVLAEDPRPAFYVYEQTFKVSFGFPPQARSFVRRGVLGALRLEPFGEGRVFPHEETFPSHKADRLQLFRACRANFSPVFGLVPDEGRFAALLQEVTAKRPPDLEVREESGVVNRVWIVSEPEACRKVSQALGERKVFIADGHHRYETACNYRNERRAEAGAVAGGDEPYEYVLMMCVPMSDPGLLILPTHRLVRLGKKGAAAKFLHQTEALFERRAANEAELAALAERTSGPVQYGVACAGGDKVILTAKPAAAEAMRKAAPDKSDAWRGLDTAVLHELLLKGLLGIGKTGPAPHEIVGYTKDVNDVLTQVAAGAYSLGFVLRPSQMEQVRKVAEAGERMPQKSTYFSPKLLSGLVMRRM